MRRALARQCSAAVRQQWQHFTEHCGDWRGTWHRIGIDKAGDLARAASFGAVCRATLTPDAAAVSQVNRYPQGFQPPGPRGTLVDGMHEVDFGRFDLDNFLRPFGPRSAAIYLPGAAAIGAASTAAAAEAGMFAVELALTVNEDPRQRRRLVAMWRGARGDALRLASVTAIAEADGSGPASCQLGVGVGKAVSWRVGRSTALRLGGAPCDSLTGTAAAPTHSLPGAMAAWLPRELTQPPPGRMEFGLGWRHGAELLRVAAVYEDGAFTSASRGLLVAER